MLVVPNIILYTYRITLRIRDSWYGIDAVHPPRPIGRFKFTAVVFYRARTGETSY